MLQEITAAAAGGTNAADATKNMGFGHLIQEMTAHPSEFAVSWIVLITLVVMSALSWYWTVINFIKNQIVNTAQTGVTAANMIKQAARCSDQNMSYVLHFVFLLLR